MTCVNADDRSDIDRTMQLIGGTLGDGTPWKVAVPDAAALIESDRVDFYVTKPNGEKSSLIAATSQNGRKYVRTKPDPSGQTNLKNLPTCS